MKEKPDSFQSTSWDSVLLRWTEIVQQGDASLRSLPETQAILPRREGKWSPKQIIGHLIDSAANNHQRFVRAQFTDELSFVGYDQDEWVRAQGYQDADWIGLIDLWKHYNMHLIRLCSLIPEETRTLPRSKHNLDEIAWQTIPKSEPVTLEYFIRDYARHLLHHLLQIFPEKEFLTRP